MEDKCPETQKGKSSSIEVIRKNSMDDLETLGINLGLGV
jgi:hypothetical protein